LLNEMLAPYYEQVERICNLRRAYQLPFSDFNKSFKCILRQHYFILRKVFKIERKVIRGYLDKLFASYVSNVPPVAEKAITVLAEKVEEVAISKELAKVVEDNTAVSVAETPTEPLSDKGGEQDDCEDETAESQTETQDGEDETEDTSDVEVLC
jgi:hypothetical protein